MPWDDAIGKIKLPPGTVGKLAMLGVAACVCLAAMAIAVRTVGVVVLAMCLLAMIVVLIVCGVLWFAHKHPQAALMEGAEFLQYEMQRTKYTPSQPVLGVVGDKATGGAEAGEFAGELLLPETEASDG